ncbi:MAG: HNH endonuclease [Planctomycetaceae bacterium]|nr:HNH endonuclease [Planctomycetaceae bacterium]
MDRSLQQHIRDRAEGVCEYCRVPDEFDPLPYHMDHIIARKHHGPTEPDNLAWACFACNNQKQSDISGIDQEGDPNTPVRLFHPRRDDWQTHYRWNGAILVGLAAIGRVTVDVLSINLPHRVGFREFLIEEGVFPNAQ